MQETRKVKKKVTDPINKGKQIEKEVEEVVSCEARDDHSAAFDS